MQKTKTFCADKDMEIHEKLRSFIRHNRVSEVEEVLSDSSHASLPPHVLIHHKDDFGNTLLHAAAQSGSRRMVKLCLQHGADINAQNYQGLTALHYCFGLGYTELGNYLLQKGADDSIVCKRGFTVYEMGERGGGVRDF